MTDDLRLVRIMPWQIQFIAPADEWQLARGWGGRGGETRGLGGVCVAAVAGAACRLRGVTPPRCLLVSAAIPNRSWARSFFVLGRHTLPRATWGSHLSRQLVPWLGGNANLALLTAQWVAINRPITDITCHRPLILILSHGCVRRFGDSLGMPSINHPNGARELHRASTLKTYPDCLRPAAPLPLAPPLAIPFTALPFECFQCINFRFLWHLSGHSQGQPRAFYFSFTSSIVSICFTSFPIDWWMPKYESSHLISSHLNSAHLSWP